MPQRIKPEHIKPDTVLLHQDKFGDVESILGANGSGNRRESG